MAKKKVIIAAGGSGGHLYPAIGLAKKLLAARNDLELLFVASGLDKNQFFDREQFQYKSISSGTFRGWSPVSTLIGCKNIAIGYAQSLRILRQERPDIVIGFGSFHTFPLLLAARTLKYPIILHEQNSKPGRVIRYFSKKALFTGVYFSTAIQQLTGECLQLAMPLREGYRKNGHTSELVYSYYGLDPMKKTVLVFGGSQGAQFINEIASKSLASLEQQKEIFQVLHFTGNMTEVECLKKFYSTNGIQAIIKKFEDRMDYAWQAADFCIVRAGAGSIAEQMEYEVPGILIPYPYAADAHQDSNADYFVDVVCGGWKFCEKDLDSTKLTSLCKLLLDPSNSILEDKKKKLAEHKQTAIRHELSTVIENMLQKT